MNNSKCWSVHAGGKLRPLGEIPEHSSAIQNVNGRPLFYLLAVGGAIGFPVAAHPMRVLQRLTGSELLCAMSIEFTRRVDVTKRLAALSYEELQALYKTDWATLELVKKVAPERLEGLSPWADYPMEMGAEEVLDVVDLLTVRIHLEEVDESAVLQGYEVLADSARQYPRIKLFPIDCPADLVSKISRERWGLFQKVVSELESAGAFEEKDVQAESTLDDFFSSRQSNLSSEIAPDRVESPN